MPNNNHKSQTILILEHLQAGNTLTRLQALNLGFGIELPTRIFEIENDMNIPVKHEMIKVNNKRVAQYSIAQKINNDQSSIHTA